MVAVHAPLVPHPRLPLLVPPEGLPPPARALAALVAGRAEALLPPPPPPAPAEPAWLISAAHLHALYPGLVGGIVASFMYREDGWKTSLSAAVAGTGVSYYAAPWVSEKLAMGDNGEGLCGFVLGLCGMFIARNLIKDPFGFVRRAREFGGELLAGGRPGAGPSAPLPPPAGRDPGRDPGQDKEGDRGHL